MSKATTALVVSAGLLVVMSSVGAIWGKHQARTQFIELQRLQAERDRLDIEWGQLKLEQSYAATPGRVEQVAYTQLQMVTPRPADVRIVQQSAKESTP